MAQPPLSVRILAHSPVKLDRIEKLGPTDLPGIAVAQPVVGGFDLETIVDSLVENPVLVAQAVSVGRQLQRRHRIQEAGGQPPQSPIPQPRIELHLAQLLQIVAQFVQSLVHAVVDTQVDQAVAQGAADQKFQRQVVYPLDILVVVGLLRLQPALDHPVAHRERQGDETVVLSGGIVVFGQRKLQMVDQRLLQRAHVHPLELVGQRGEFDFGIFAWGHRSFTSLEER